MRDYDKGELFAAMYANLDAEELRQLAAQLAYNPRLDSLRYRKLWLDTAQVISDILALCERRQVMPLLVNTLQERFPAVLADAPTLESNDEQAEAIPSHYAAPALMSVAPSSEATALAYSPPLWATTRTVWPTSDTQAAVAAIQGQDNGVLSVANPLHWLLVISCFIFKPRRLRQYRQGLNISGELTLRRVALWGVNSLVCLPIAAFWLYQLLAPNHWLRETSFIPLVGIIGIWLGVSWLVPVNHSTLPYGAGASVGIAFGVALSAIIGGATAMVFFATNAVDVLLLAFCLLITSAASVMVQAIRKGLEIIDAAGFAATLLTFTQVFLTLLLALSLLFLLVSRQWVADYMGFSIGAVLVIMLPIFHAKVGPKLEHYLVSRIVGRS